MSSEFHQISQISDHGVSLSLHTDFAQIFRRIRIVIIAYDRMDDLSALKEALEAKQDNDMAQVSSISLSRLIEVICLKTV